MIKYTFNPKYSLREVREVNRIRIEYLDKGEGGDDGGSGSGSDRGSDRGEGKSDRGEAFTTTETVSSTVSNTISLPNTPQENTVAIESITSMNCKWRNVFKVTFDKEFTYEPGDSIGLYVPNEDRDVKELMEICKIKNEHFRIVQEGEGVREGVRESVNMKEGIGETVNMKEGVNRESERETERERENENVTLQSTCHHAFPPIPNQSTRISTPHIPHNHKSTHTPPTPTPPTPIHYQGPIFNFLKNHLDMTSLPKRMMLLNLSKRAKKRKELEYLASKEGEKDYLGMGVRMNGLVEILKEFECEPTVEELLRNYEEIKPRYFSFINEGGKKGEILVGIIKKEIEGEVKYGHVSKFIENLNGGRGVCEGESKEERENLNLKESDREMDQEEMGQEERDQKERNNALPIHNPHNSPHSLPLPLTPPLGNLKFTYRTNKLFSVETNKDKEFVCFCTGTGIALFLSLYRTCKFKRILLVYGFRDEEDDLTRWFGLGGENEEGESVTESVTERERVCKRDLKEREYDRESNTPSNVTHSTTHLHLHPLSDTHSDTHPFLHHPLPPCKIKRCKSSEGVYVTSFSHLIEEYKDPVVFVCGNRWMQRDVYKKIREKYPEILKEGRLCFDSWQ